MRRSILVSNLVEITFSPIALSFSHNLVAWGPWLSCCTVFICTAGVRNYD